MVLSVLGLPKDRIRKSVDSTSFPEEIQGLGLKHAYTHRISMVFILILLSTTTCAICSLFNYG